MQKKILKYACVSFVFMCFFSCIFMSGEEVHADSGKYTYEISGNAIRKINLANGKITTTKIKSKKRQAGYAMTAKNVQEKNGYLYYTINTYPGTTYIWEYICRVNVKNGKGFQVLAKGNNPKIVGNRIYYSKTRFNPKSKKDQGDYNVGVYSMKLDGRDQKKIVLNKELICEYQGYLYVKDLSDGKLMKYTLNGTEGKVITEQSCTWGDYYMVNGCLFYGIDKYDNENRKSNYYYMLVNLEKNKAELHSIPYQFVGASNEYLFFKGNYPSNKLYYREIKGGTYKRFGKIMRYPSLCYGGSQNYFMFTVTTKVTGNPYNVIINLKKNKLKRVSKYYTSL